MCVCVRVRLRHRGRIECPSEPTSFRVNSRPLPNPQVDPFSKPICPTSTDPSVFFINFTGLLSNRESPSVLIKSYSLPTFKGPPGPTSPVPLPSNFLVPVFPFLLTVSSSVRRRLKVLFGVSHSPTVYCTGLSVPLW